MRSSRRWASRTMFSFAAGSVDHSGDEGLDLAAVEGESAISVLPSPTTRVSAAPDALRVDALQGCATTSCAEGSRCAIRAEEKPASSAPMNAERPQETGATGGYESTFPTRGTYQADRLAKRGKERKLSDPCPRVSRTDAVAGRSWRGCGAEALSSVACISRSHL